MITVSFKKNYFLQVSQWSDAYLITKNILFPLNIIIKWKDIIKRMKRKGYISGSFVLGLHFRSLVVLSDNWWNPQKPILKCPLKIYDNWLASKRTEPCIIKGHFTLYLNRIQYYISLLLFLIGFIRSLERHFFWLALDVISLMLRIMSICFRSLKKKMVRVYGRIALQQFFRSLVGLGLC